MVAGEGDVARVSHDLCYYDRTYLAVQSRIRSWTGILDG